MRLCNNAIDRRFTVGKELAMWRANLEKELGGDISAHQSAMIDLAVKLKLILDSIDCWLLCEKNLANKRKKNLIPW